MPFNGSGGFISLSPPDYPAVPGTTITASQHNNNLSDIFQGLSNCVTRDGQSPASANIPMGGFKHTNAAAATTTGQYLVWGQADYVIVGGSSQTYASGLTPMTQLNWTSSLPLGVSSWSNSATGGTIEVAKSRGSVVGGHTVVQNNDVLMSLQAEGSDGAQFRAGAKINVEVDGTPGSNDMPSRMVFYVSPDGSATPAEAMRISNNKAASLAGSLTVTGATGLSSTLTASGVTTLGSTLNVAGFATFSGGTKGAVASQGFSTTPSFDFTTKDQILFGTLTGNVTASITLNVGQVGVVYVRQDGTGGRTFAVSGAVVAGSVGTVANQFSILTLSYSGTALYAAWTVYV